MPANLQIPTRFCEVSASDPALHRRPGGRRLGRAAPDGGPARLAVGVVAAARGPRLGIGEGEAQATGARGLGLRLGVAAVAAPEVVAVVVVVAQAEEPHEPDD